VKWIAKYTESTSYCGGAAPRQEMLDNITAPMPIAFKRLYIKKGTTNNIKDKNYLLVKTDSSGIITAVLKPGLYYVVADNKLNGQYYQQILKKYAKASKNYKAVNKTCLKNWLLEPMARFEVKANSMDTFAINVSILCPWQQQPCVDFTGPFPQ
jgi:hypothetical protein